MSRLHLFLFFFFSFSFGLKPTCEGETLVPDDGTGELFLDRLDRVHCDFPAVIDVDVLEGGTVRRDGLQRFVREVFTVNGVEIGKRRTLHGDGLDRRVREREAMGAREGLE